MKKLLFICLSLICLMSCELQKCKMCTTVTTCPGASPITVTAEACGKDLRDVDGKTVTVISSGYTITSRTTCK
jgi:hypothetical protein